MTAKEYLGRYRHLKADIDNKTEQLKELRTLAESVGYSSGTGCSGETSDKVGKTVAKIVDMENDISCQIEKLFEVKKEIEEIIAKVDNFALRQVLMLRYINGYTFERIAEKMFYTYKWVCILHSKALNAVIVPDMEKST